jgi:hypothetical protein
MKERVNCEAPKCLPTLFLANGSTEGPLETDALSRPRYMRALTTYKLAQRKGCEGNEVH